MALQCCELENGRAKKKSIRTHSGYRGCMRLVFIFHKFLLQKLLLRGTELKCYTPMMEFNVRILCAMCTVSSTSGDSRRGFDVVTIWHLHKLDY